MIDQSSATRHACLQYRTARIESLETRQLLTAIIYVDQNAPGPVHDGSSWDNALTDLQSAMGAAGPGNEIRVADGTYAASAASPVQLKTGVAVLGGFAGSGAANPDARDIIGTRSVISGYTGLILGGATDSTAVFDGFTVESSNFTVESSNFSGVSIVNDHSSPTIRNCTFTGGTGMNNSNSSPTVVNCLFTNTEYGYGAGR